MLNALPLLVGGLFALPSQQGDKLQIDPQLITKAAEVWSIIAQKENPVWPGWNAAGTPILIYLPNKQDVLIGHPKPPAGFRTYGGPLSFGKERIAIKDGPTLIDLDGQNTSKEIEEVGTLVIADTLSTKRQWAEGLAQQAAGGEKDMLGQINGGLLPDAYASMAMFAHEAFHVYQGKVAKNKGGNETALLEYPALSVENNVDLALEADALIEAIDAKPADLHRAAVKWLSIREARQTRLGEAQRAYEDGTEFNEGLAKYVEYRLYQTLTGRQPLRDMWLVQGFTGYDEMPSRMHQLLERMKQMMSGKANVNNDPYGASPVRMRLYFSGMGVGALLDRLGAKWHDRILQPGTTLTGLARDAIKASPSDLAAAYESVKASAAYMALRPEKEKLEADGKAHIESVLRTIDAAPGLLELDFSALEKPRVGLAFTPFGILRVDEDRAIYRLIPLRGIINDLSFWEDAARPILANRTKKTFTMMLTGPLSADGLAKLLGPSWATEEVALENVGLPGVTMTKVRGTFRLDGKRLIFKAK